MQGEKSYKTTHTYFEWSDRIPRSKKKTMSMKYRYYKSLALLNIMDLILMENLQALLGHKI